MTPPMQMIYDAFESAWGYVIFCFAISWLYAMLLTAALFGGLLLREIWQWLTVHSFSHVVVLLERRALRGRP
jgi:hypothetical protein